ncbi:MAG: hypothetical protein ACJ780_29740 [Solirubrobacteraceae bacterium]
MVVVGCGGVTTAGTSRSTGANAAPSSSAASCAAQTPGQDRARAEVVVDAVALPGRSAPRSRTLLSPARFRVLRYLKGHGSRVVEVETAVSATMHSGAYGVVEDGIQPRAGERWLIYGQRSGGRSIATGLCGGSRRLHAAAQRQISGSRHRYHRPGTIVNDDIGEGILTQSYEQIVSRFGAPLKSFVGRHGAACTYYDVVGTAHGWIFCFRHGAMISAAGSQAPPGG